MKVVGWFLWMLSIIAVNLSPLPVFAQFDASGTLAQADAAYLAHDYRIASSLYESVIESGVRDPAVYFNLGNTYYHLGDLGQSMLNYRKAQQFWPRDSDLRQNIARISFERIDFQGDETGFVEGVSALTDGFLTLTELNVVVNIGWTLWFVLLGIILIGSAQRKTLRIPIIILGVFLAVGLFILGARVYVHIMRPPAVVIQQVTQVKSGPGDAYLDLYQLHAAADIRIWEARGGWVQFASPDGQLGWLPSQAVVMVGD